MSHQISIGDWKFPENQIEVGEKQPYLCTTGLCLHRCIGTRCLGLTNSLLARRTSIHNTFEIRFLQRETVKSVIEIILTLAMAVCRTEELYKYYFFLLRLELRIHHPSQPSSHPYLEKRLSIHPSRAVASWPASDTGSLNWTNQHARPQRPAS